MRVVAIERGHDGRQIREINEEFDVPAERLEDGSTWFVAAGKAPEPAPPPPTETRPLGSGPTPPATVNAERPPGAGPVAGSALQPPPADPATSEPAPDVVPEAKD